MDQKGPVLGPFLERFSIRGYDPDPLGVSSDLEFWSQISESTNPPFFRNFSAQTKILDRGANHPTPNCEIVSYDRLHKFGWGYLRTQV